MRWDGAPQIITAPRGAMGALRAVMRATAILVMIGLGFVVLLLLRGPERAAYGARRPLTPWVTQVVSRLFCAILGLRIIRHGAPLQASGAIVANHVSWLDIFALNSGGRVTFVAKSEVRGWAGIGILARAVGTVFIERRRMAAKAQTALLQARLSAAQPLVIFPEGTSTDGLRVLPFKSTLFDALFAHHMKNNLRVQPVTIAYHAPKGEDPAFYGWWGSQGFASGLWRVLSVRKNGHVALTYHPSIALEGIDNRKEISERCFSIVRDGLEAEISPKGPEAP